MKLLVLAPDFPNADGTYRVDIFIKEQIRFLEKYFDEIVVISPVAYGMDFFRKTRYKDYNYNNVRVFFPRYFNFPLFYFIHKEFWLNREMNVTLHFISEKKIKPDIIHAHFTWPSGAVAVRLKKVLGVPVVITEHTSTSFIQAIETRDKIYISTWESADKIIRVRGGDVFSFQRVGIDLKKIVSIPNGYDEAIFHPENMEDCRRKLGLPTNKKIILNIGNLYNEIKGHKYLIDAIKLSTKQNNDILCYIIGSGKLYKKLKKQISDLGLDKQVILVGGKMHTELPLWINACDVFVLPSLIESFGIVQIEAMACGKPVVATRNGGSEEVITSEKVGLLVIPADPEDLAKNILLALNREWNQETILKHVNKYAWENVVGDIIRIYKKILPEGLI